MNIAIAHETARLQSIIDAQVRELAHRANVITALADRLATTRAELDEAIRAGSEYATALRFCAPHHPVLRQAVALKATSGPFESPSGPPAALPGVK